MNLWLSVLAVIASNGGMKADGPLALGERRLPPRAVKVISLMAVALLAGLIVTCRTRRAPCDAPAVAESAQPGAESAAAMPG